MFKNHLKIALRNISKYKTYSLINVAGLAIGMACCLFITLWIMDELSFDTFHKNGDNIYRIIVTTKDDVWQSSPWALITNLKRDYPEIEKASWFYDATVNASYQEITFNERIALVAPDFLEMFTFPCIKGNSQTLLRDVNSIVMSKRTALKYFGSEDPIGKVINLDSQVDLTVTGIIENVPDNSHIQFDLLARPEIFVSTERMQSWSMDCPSYIMLSKGIDYKEVVGKISGSIMKYDKRGVYQCSVGLQPLGKIHLYALKGTDPVIYVYIFTAIAVLVLLIASINFMNLSTARSAVRAKEIGVRKVIGAKRSDVIKQFFSESIVLSVMALFIAVILVYLFLPTFNTIAEKQLTLDLTGNYKIGLGLLLIALLTGIMSGIYPSLYLSSFQPVTILKSSIVKGGKSPFLRRALIIFQFSAAVCLIISTAVILKQMNYIKTKDLGFNRDHIITISMNDELLSKKETLKQELLKNRDILSVSAACNLPLNTNNNETVYWEGMEADRSVLINFVSVDYDYFETFDMKMSDGRSFSKKYSTYENSFIINETALKMIGYEHPIGRTFTVWKTRGEIIGVVKDFHGTSLHNQIKPTVFMLYQYDVLPKRRLFVKVNPVNMPATIKHIENTMAILSPDFIFEYRFMDDYFNQQYISEQNLQNLLKYFTILAIFISCLGLLGLSSFMMEQKTKEIAIRKILGDSSMNLVARLIKEFMMLVVIANIIAWPVAYFSINQWLHNFVYRTNMGILIFISSGVLALLIAFFTVSYQSIKAVLANPVDSLRCE